MKRLKPILKWAAVFVVVLIALLLMANAYFVWSTGTALERRFAELRQAGQPVQLSDLVHAPLPPEQDASTFLRRAAADLEAIEKEVQSSFPRMVFPSHPLTPAETAKLRKVFEAYPNVMPLLEQAAACPDYDPQFDGSLPSSKAIEPLMDHITRYRQLARVVRARTTWLVAEGRVDDAVGGSVVLLRLTRFWTHQPLLIGYLVTLACEGVALDGLNEALRAGPVSPVSRRALDAELELHDSLEGLRRAMESERAFSLTTTQEFPNARLWLTRGFANNLQLGILSAFDQVFWQLDASSIQAGHLQPFASGSPGVLNPLQPLVNLLGPALDGTFEATDRSLAHSRSLRVLNALQSRATPVTGPPPKLNELGLPPRATIDPFNREPLYVKALPRAGWSIPSGGTGSTTAASSRMPWMSASARGSRMTACG